MHKRAMAVIFLTFIMTPATRSMAQDRTSTPPYPDLVPELEARGWLNPQPAQLYARPQYALVVFLSCGSPLSTPMRNAINELQRRYHGGRLMLIGLSEEKIKPVDQYLRREKIKFKVGAESRSAKKFGVAQVPAAILVDLKTREVRWRAEGPELETKSLQKAIREFLGDPEGLDRSARLSAEEANDRSLVAAHIAAGEAEVSGITEQVLTETSEQEWIEPEDLAVLDDFYEGHLPSDPLVPGATSETSARGFAMGLEGDTGYGGLYKSGRLSEAAKAYVRDRLLSIAQDDPSTSARMSAMQTIRRQIGTDAGDSLDAMRAMRNAEPDRWVRASWDMTIDAADRSPSPEVQARLHRTQNATQLRRMLRKDPNPNASRWSDAQNYLETVSQRSTESLLADCHSFSDSEDDALRENAVLKRSFAISTVAGRIEEGKDLDVPGLATGLLQTLGAESDPVIRMSTVEALQSLAKQVSTSERQQIASGLEQFLPAESDPYFARPMVEEAIEDIKKLP